MSSAEHHQLEILLHHQPRKKTLELEEAKILVTKLEEVEMDQQVEHQLMKPQS